MDEAQRMQLQLASLVQPITSGNRPSTARHAVAAPVPRARPLAALVSPPGAAPGWRSSAPQAGTARPATARPHAPYRGWVAVAADQFRRRDAGHIAVRDSTSSRQRTKSEQLDSPMRGAPPSLRRSMSEQLNSSGPMVSPPSQQRSTSGLHEPQEGPSETTAHKATGTRTTKKDPLRPQVVTSSARRTAKGLFRRQSIAEIIAEGRELKTHHASDKEDCPPEGGETSLLLAAEAAAAARVRRASARHDSDAARELPEDALLKAAAAAAFAKIGSIQVNRTRSRSTSPGRSARSRGTQGYIGRDGESGRNESPLGSPIMRTGSRGSLQGTTNTPMSDWLRFSAHAFSMHACMALQ